MKLSNMNQMNSRRPHGTGYETPYIGPRKVFALSTTGCGNMEAQYGRLLTKKQAQIQEKTHMIFNYNKGSYTFKSQAQDCSSVCCYFGNEVRNGLFHAPQQF